MKIEFDLEQILKVCNGADELITITAIILYARVKETNLDEINKLDLLIHRLRSIQLPRYVSTFNIEKLEDGSYRAHAYGQDSHGLYHSPQIRVKLIDGILGR